MRELFVLGLLVLIGMVLFNHFRNAGGDEETAPLPAPTRLPIDKSMAIGDEATLVHGGKAYRYGVSMVMESRCPRGERCPDEGEALVVVWIEGAGERRQTLKLSTADSSSSRFGPVDVWLLELIPHPQAGRVIAKDAYRITLHLDKPFQPGVFGKSGTGEARSSGWIRS